MDEEGNEQNYAPGIDELVIAENLLERLRKIKETDRGRGREWAIAATDAEKLVAWISYVVGLADTE